MRFNNILLAGAFAVAYAQETTVTTVPGVATPTGVDAAASSAAAAINKCLKECDATDSTCQARCVSVPAPSDAQAIALDNAVTSASRSTTSTLTPQTVPLPTTATPLPRRPLALLPVPRPPTSIKADFLEQFTDDWETRWKPSHAKKETDGEKEDEEWAYVGEWSVEEPSVFKGVEGDKGLVVKNPAAHHAISAKFPKAIDNKGKTLVVQYEVKLQSECP
ncbi:hypothetical protein BN1723_016656 [Verticillium longisporum]|uniref:Calnexin n=1 Tax=Verticillium longisporum TaxID=100787 RepID=A0A0G4NIH5_VERLO|nr:hypothetical protein BN1723_016656 [Verticillium longisporum]